PQVTELPGGQEVLVEVKIVEGNTYDISALDVFEEKDGKRLPPEAWSTTLKPGDRFSRKTLIDSLMAMRTHYRDQGYAYVEADPETKMDPKKKQVAFSVPIRRGMLTHFGHFHFTGNKTTTEAVLRKQILVTEGTLYHDTNL